MRDSCARLSPNFGGKFTNPCRECSEGANFTAVVEYTSATTRCTGVFYSALITSGSGLHHTVFNWLVRTVGVLLGLILHTLPCFTVGRSNYCRFKRVMMPQDLARLFLIISQNLLKARTYTSSKAFYADIF